MSHDTLRGRFRKTRYITAAACTALVMSACSDPVSVDLVPLDPTGSGLELVVGGLDAPVFVTAPERDADRLFIVEQSGRIKIFRNGALLGSPFVDLSGLVSRGNEQGLLGLAFHPEYESNGLFFVNYTDVAGDTRVVRYSRSSDPDLAEANSATLVLTVGQPFSNHNGGQLAFGPDGMLYIGMGDGGSGGDPDGHGQNLSTLLGTLLRIDIDGGAPYSVPSDNPFVGLPGALPEIWAYGLRNPWRFSFDRENGDLWIGDVGQREAEEISFQSAAADDGLNYGWNALEGSRCYVTTPCDPAGTTLPVYEYSHTDGCSVTGGYVYRGSLLSALTGRYFFADFCGGWVRSFRLSGTGVTDLVDHTPAFGQVPNISSFGEDASGELYVVSLGGAVYRVVAAG